ncbi:MAG: putative transport system ATP-binding protein [Patescibacteria group bacterium]|nr:putative transport system ATP-binding protein [Patescibacteria group bacterium]
MSIIKIDNLKRTYGTKVLTYALKGVTFEVSGGDFLIIMGKSGSGKSTLLHQLGLLDTPTSGEIFIKNENTKDLSEKKKTIFRLEKLGYIFQEYAILPELTALENVYLPLMVSSNNGKKDFKKTAMEMLKLVGLEHRFDHYSNELSGGEQQRVAIARALVNNPEVLFADEPCANLDTQASKNILDLLKGLNKKLGQTIIMVSHEPEDKKYADRILWLEDGLIVKDERVK